jgi:hypothetical protein
MTKWLGWLDSNQRMAVPKTAALPLGDTPKPENVHQKGALRPWKLPKLITFGNQKMHARVNKRSKIIFSPINTGIPHFLLGRAP